MHFSGQHGAPNIDALGHIGRDGKLFGGVDAAASTSDPDGIGASGVGAHLAIDQFPKDLLINRGVLLDVASMINGNLDPLPAGFEITAKHLAQAAHRQRVKLRKGDIVFIRTGWGPYFKSEPDIYKGAVLARPGTRCGGVPDQARCADRRQRHADLREAPADCWHARIAEVRGVPGPHAAHRRQGDLHHREPRPREAWRKRGRTSSPS